MLRCTCDKETLTKSFFYVDKRYFIRRSTSQVHYCCEIIFIKGLSFALIKDKDSTSNNGKFQVLSSWLIKAAENNTFCFPSIK